MLRNIFIKKTILPILAVTATVIIIGSGCVTIADLSVELTGAILFTLIYGILRNTFAASIKFSPIVARDFQTPNKIFYKLKFINTSLGTIRNVQIIASLSKSYGDNVIKSRIETSTSHIPYIPGLINSSRKYRSNAFLINLEAEELDSITDGAKLELNIQCRDSVIGIERYFQHEYELPASVVTGRFAFGYSFDVM